RHDRVWYRARNTLRPFRLLQARIRQNTDQAGGLSSIRVDLRRTCSPLSPEQGFPGSCPHRHLRPGATPTPAAGFRPRRRLAPERQNADADHARGLHDTVAQFVATVLEPCESRFFSARDNQTLASCQSRITVIADTCNTSAVSSTFNPPKNRS